LPDTSHGTPDPPPVLLAARDVTMTFRSPEDGTVLTVLAGVSLVVRPGEFVSIVGPSGSGKSTLLYCLSGLEPYTSGSVQINGRRLDALRPKALAALRRDVIGFVFQSFNLIPSLTARQNVALPASLAHRRLDVGAIDGALASVGLADRADHRPGALSGGQQQRVAIARVLAGRPALVFADEPTGALDTKAGREVLGLLRKLASGHRAVVMVTHDLEAAAATDRVLVLRDGVIHEELAHPTSEAVLASITRAAQEA
jgi:putative ABC transport system ATP-binding protein